MFGGSTELPWSWGLMMKGVGGGGGDGWDGGSEEVEAPAKSKNKVVSMRNSQQMIQVKTKI